MLKEIIMKTNAIFKKQKNNIELNEIIDINKKLNIKINTPEFKFEIFINYNEDAKNKIFSFKYQNNENNFSYLIEKENIENYVDKLMDIYKYRRISNKINQIYIFRDFCQIDEFKDEIISQNLFIESINYIKNNSPKTINILQKRAPEVLKYVNFEKPKQKKM